MNNQNQIQDQKIKVFLKLHGINAEEGAEATCDIGIGESVMTMWGDPKMITDATSGLCHVFSAEANEDVNLNYDFVGEIRLDKNNAMPSAQIKLTRSMGAEGLLTNVFLKIGPNSMSYGVRSWDAASNLAKGLSEMLGLTQKDKQGKLYSGQLVL